MVTKLISSFVLYLVDVVDEICSLKWMLLMRLEGARPYQPILMALRSLNMLDDSTAPSSQAGNFQLILPVCHYLLKKCINYNMHNLLYGC